MAILIIDGHGDDMNFTFSFKRSFDTRCNLYSYTAGDIAIGQKQSNKYIKTALGGNVPKNYYSLNKSKIGGSLLPDRALYSQTGKEWSVPIPGKWKKYTGKIDGCPIVVYCEKTANDSDVVFIKVKDGDDDYTYLSDIMDFFNNRSYDVLWMPCRGGRGAFANKSRSGKGKSEPLSALS